MGATALPKSLVCDLGTVIVIGLGCSKRHPFRYFLLHVYATIYPKALPAEVHPTLTNESKQNF
jgi:hypothetical protein